MFLSRMFLNENGLILTALAKCTGRKPHFPDEGMCKVSAVRKTNIQGNLGDGQVRGLQQVASLFNSVTAQVCQRGNTKFLTETISKIVRTDVEIGSA